MSRQINDPAQQHRDYGATSSSTNIPDVTFSGFSPTEFMSLSEDIAHNIQKINGSWKDLEKSLKVIGTPRDKKSTRDRVHNISEKTNGIIEVTSKDLQRLTSVVRRADKQQKLQLEKLTNDFRAVVERYSEAQQRILAAMKRNYVNTQSMQQREEDEEHTETERLNRLQQQMQLEANLQAEHDLLVERQREITRLEADILDVNSIMRTISDLVHTQGEQFDRIETSVEEAATNVEAGREELQKASQHRQSYRRKILILLVIAVIIGLIVTGILVSKLSS